MHFDANHVRAIVESFVTAFIASQREVHGTEWCMNFLVGPWRRIAGASYPSNVVLHAVPESDAAMAFAGRQFTADFLREECRKCPGPCPLAQRDS